MTRTRKLGWTAGVSLLVLAACDGSDGIIGNPSTQFGSIFAAAFAADMNAAPVNDPLTITYRGTTGPSLTAAPLDL